MADFTFDVTNGNISVAYGGDEAPSINQEPQVQEEHTVALIQDPYMTGHMVSSSIHVEDDHDEGETDAVLQASHMADMAFEQEVEEPETLVLAENSRIMYIKCRSHERHGDERTSDRGSRKRKLSEVLTSWPENSLASMGLDARQQKQIKTNWRQRNGC